MVTLMIIVFVLGYLMIALEHPLKLNKAGVALLMGCVLWILYRYALPAMGDNVAKTIEIIEGHITASVGEIWQTLLLLLGAMTIVQIVDMHGGFTYISKIVTTKSKVKLLWTLSILTFFLSAVLDNMTTTIVMVMILRRLISEKDLRWLFGGFIVIAANAGGAFSPIGDVTTIMLWARNNVTAGHIIPALFLPSIASLILPLIAMSFMLKGNVVTPSAKDAAGDDEYLVKLQEALSDREKLSILFLGIFFLIMTPIFKSITHLPPFVGVITGVACLWVITDVFYARRKNLQESLKLRVVRVIQTVDFSTIMFFFGILMAVKTLTYMGILDELAHHLEPLGLYTQNILIGFCSSVVDNVPLVAAAQGMYPITAGDPIYGVDGYFWDLLAFCAGTGGSILIIGSAAGVAFMGLENVSFGWFMKKVTPLAILGFFGGVLVFFIQYEWTAITAWVQSVI